MLIHWVAINVVIRGITAFPTFGNFASTPSSLIFRDTDDEFYPDDLSFIKKLAAVGDSYSAGIGAGDLLGGFTDWLCRRYDHSYPNILNQDQRLGDPKQRSFEFHSCSGAVINEVIDDQLPHVSQGQDVILLSAGGNDAELVDILNQCVFQWASFNWKQVGLAKIAQLLEKPWLPKGINFDKLGRGCDGQLQDSRDIILSAKFAGRLDSVIEATRKKLAPGGMIYYTGYAKFFDTDLDPACDKVSWSTWIYKTYNIWLPEARLTTANRRTMNTLVDLMNEKLEEAVKRAGPEVEFVNYDAYVGRYHGRFCVPGVDESSAESNTRMGLMFYEMNTKDLWGSNPWKRDTHGNPNGTFEGDQDVLAGITQFIDPDATLVQAHRIEDDKSATSNANAEMAQAAVFELPNILPDGYGRVFHPQILLHEIIANLVLYRITVRREQQRGWPKYDEIDNTPPSCPVRPGDQLVLHYKHTPPGKLVKKDTELRILPVGDSITVGFLSEKNGGDGDGYRRQMKNDLSKDKVVFAGTEDSGSMDNGYYAAWSGKTIQYISDHVDPSLDQRPNIVLVAAGTNDMNPNHAISTEGNDPAQAADRLGKLIDKIVKKCPDATILVAMIINTCDPAQSSRTNQYQQLIPAIVKQRKDAGKHVLTVDFTTFETSRLQDCIHPTNDGYKVMGDYWYDFITQIPSSWIKKPVGPGPTRDGGSADNGGIDKNIPPPDWGTSPVQPVPKQQILDAAKAALGDKYPTCKTKPHWIGAGRVALGGVGHNGDWKYHKDWKETGKVADGLGLDTRYVRLHDMNGDGKSDYVWIHPETGEIRCWLNNLPEPWSPAGTNNSIIGAGAGPAKYIYLADMNGDGMDDYLVVDPKKGSVRVWWNYGPDKNWSNGWKFVEGGVIASGVPHANLNTLRFPDINGDGRADYVYIGEGGALKHHMNTGTVGGQDPLFIAQGGIATGAVQDITRLVFADINGDGRDDYLIWDNDGGLTGFLNQPTNREGVPVYIDQGPAKTIADGIHKSPKDIILADMDGDGKDDYVFVGDNGALYLWYNRGTTDDSMTIDGLRFARITGSKANDYVWLDPKTGKPTVYWNIGPSPPDDIGWRWIPFTGAQGKPIASGAAPAAQVQFGDVDGDGSDDYLVVDPKTGAVTAYLNLVNKPDSDGNYFRPIGEIATGLGPGKNVRFADIDGDGRDDYIYLHPNGGTTIYRNVYYTKDSPKYKFTALPEADASGIAQRPEEISFQDINGDGKADYIWTRALDGRVEAWLNMYPQVPSWQGIGEIAGGVGTSGSNVRYAQLLGSGGRSDYIAVDPSTGAIAPWLNGCDDPDKSEPKHRVGILKVVNRGNSRFWMMWDYFDNGLNGKEPDFCNVISGIGGVQPSNVDPPEAQYPSWLESFKLFGHQCYYAGSTLSVGQLVCDGVSNIWCHSDVGKKHNCDPPTITNSVVCEW